MFDCAYLKFSIAAFKVLRKFFWFVKPAEAMIGRHNSNNIGQRGLLVEVCPRFLSHFKSLFPLHCRTRIKVYPEESLISINLIIGVSRILSLSKKNLHEAVFRFPKQIWHKKRLSCFLPPIVNKYLAWRQNVVMLTVLEGLLAENQWQRVLINRR